MSEWTAGQEFGPYEIVEELGRGGMAVVYKARQLSLDRFVALKVLTPGLASDPDFVARFHHEATIAARLEHPSIVSVYDLGQVEDSFYIAMRFVPGSSLAQLITRQGQFSLEHTVAVLSQVASALDDAHGKGIVHRDVKPSNILVEAGLRASLTDFGIARAVESPHLTRTQTIVGTPRYMAPEQAQGLEIDSRADLYALGIVTFELLTGRVPFDADSGVAILHQQIYDPPPPIRTIRPDLPPGAEAAILRMLAKKPEERWNSGAAFVKALAGAGPDQDSADRTTAAPTTMRVPRPTPPPRGATSSLRWFFGIAALGAVALVLAFVLAFRSLAAPSARPTAIPHPSPSVGLETPVPTVAPAPTNTPGLVSLRSVDWAVFLAKDPHLARDASVPPPSADLCLAQMLVRPAKAARPFAGYPDLCHVLYGQLGDGTEDAVITVLSGGSAGAVGVLVYRPTPDGPNLVAALSGDKIGARILADHLVITRARFAGWEPECCPSAVQVTRYHFVGGEITADGVKVVPNSLARALTVEHYYALLGAKQYQAAYQFLSPTLQAANPFAKWVDGFATMQRVVAQAKAGAGDTVDVNLTVTDRVNNRVDTHSFAGQWFLAFDQDREQWALNRAAIIEVGASPVSPSPIAPGTAPWTPETSPNWSGYSAPGGGATGVRARWTEPSVTGTASDHVVAWIGLGGWGSTFNNIVQIGTLATVEPGGNIRHQVWYETLPPDQWNLTSTDVSPGDEISASVTLQDAATNAWRLVITDLTKRHTFQITVHFPSERAYADFIVEDPNATNNNGPPYYPLPAFKPVTFRQAEVRYAAGWVSLDKVPAMQITLIRDGVELIRPSPLTNGTFTLTQVHR